VSGPISDRDERLTVGAVKYRLKEPASVDFGDGYIKFTVGEHTPQDEAEARALEHLADNCPQVCSRVKSKEA
jgi:hypothetical protein